MTLFTFEKVNVKGTPIHYHLFLNTDIKMSRPPSYGLIDKDMDGVWCFSANCTLRIPALLEIAAFMKQLKEEKKDV